MDRRYGYPKTEEERMMTHYQRYGTTVLPPRGTGLRLGTRSLSDADKMWLSFIIGGILGSIIGYVIAKPGAFKTKLREFRE